MEGGDAVIALHIPERREFPLRSRLQTLTGVATGVENDARLALGEGWKGRAVDSGNHVAVAVSTGVGWREVA